ncbi:MAG: ornithine racemase Orr [Clostridium sp.]
MRRSYPCIEVDLDKIKHNCKTILSICKNHGIEVVAITKGFCAKKPIINAMLEAGITKIGDARILNLKSANGMKCEKYMVRIPMESDAYNVVKYADTSLNSELAVIDKLSKAAKRADRIHNVILMVDLGDLREGVLEFDLLDTVKEILKMPNIKLVGLGTNLTCYGGVIPDKTNLGKLIEQKCKIEKILQIELPIISGGNSSSLYMVINGEIPKGINQLRIGEGIILGTESSFAKKIDNTFQDAFILKGEIVEIKNKPSVPTGTIGLNAFGEEPYFEDVGIIKRAIVAIGRQDIKLDAMSPKDEKIKILGASSDHLILDITESKSDYRVGDIVNFDVKYGCLLQAMTSPYISKYYINK